MESPWLHRYAVLLAACTLLLIATGPPVASHDAEATAPVGTLLEQSHRVMGASVGILTIGLVIWLALAVERARLRRLGWIVLAALVVEGGLGARTVLLSLPRTAGISHAFLAQLLFGSTVAVAVFTSGGWRLDPELVEDHGWLSLRSMAIATPAVVLVQVALGAAYRHKAIGLMPHLAGAMIVALVILVVCVFVTQQFPTHRSLRPAAVTLMTIAFIQVFLGVTVLSVGTFVAETEPPMVISTVAHVTTAALTLGATVVLAILLRRSARSGQALGGS